MRVLNHKRPIAVEQPRLKDIPAKDIFISWSDPEGALIAKAIEQFLGVVLPKKYKPWVSTRDIKSGDEFKSAIIHAASQCRVLVVCMTARTVESHWVAFEAGVACASGKAKIIPLEFGGNESPDFPGVFHGQQILKANSLKEMQQRVCEIYAALRARQPSELITLVKGAWSVFKKSLPSNRPAPGGGAQTYPNHALIRHPQLEERLRDLSVSNTILQAATGLDILALTFKTLAEAIENLNFPCLTKVRLRTYALPNQRFTHPTKRDAALEREWTGGIASVLEGFLNKTRCPRLQSLQLILLSTSPDFTGTFAEWAEPHRAGQRLRLTLCVGGMEMERVPTFVIDCLEGEEAATFERFKTLYKSTGTNPFSPLTYSIPPGWSHRVHLRELVSRLAKVSNHPDIHHDQDEFFTVSLAAPGRRKCQRPKSRSASDRGERMVLTPSGERPWAIGFTREQDGIAVDLPGVKLRLEPRQHFFANFVLLLQWDQKGGGYNVLLVAYNKSQRRGKGWDYDIPGGKYSRTLDRSARQNVAREVLEEVGLVLEESRLKGPAGFVYVRNSVHEEAPGLIQYFYYILEQDDLERTGGTLPDTATKGHPLVPYPLAELTAVKPARRRDALCHAPVEVLQWIENEVTKGSRRRI